MNPRCIDCNPFTPEQVDVIKRVRGMHRANVPAPQPQTNSRRCEVCGCALSTIKSLQLHLSRLSESFRHHVPWAS